MMRFRVICSFCCYYGKEVLVRYRCLERYNAVIENEELYITLNSLQDLINLRNEIREGIILDSEENLLEIYDYDDYTD